MSQNSELLSQLESELSFGGIVPKVEHDTARAADTVKTVIAQAANQELINLAQAVFLSRNGSAPHEVVLCGVDEKSGSSDICLALGRILASCSGQPVCLVDGNVRFPRLSRLLKRESLAAVSPPFGERLAQVGENLWLTSLVTLCSTRSDTIALPSELKKYLEKLRESFAFLLIDAPGVNGRSDAALLSHAANGAILVIEANSTRKAAALKAKKAMEAMDVRFLGCVLNNRTFPIPERLYRRL